MVLSRRRMIVAGLVGALIAAFVTVLALNSVASEKQIERKLEHRYTIDEPQFRRELGILLGPPIIDGNRITNLENGAEIFPAMLEAAKGARRNINFETYIYWSGDIGRAFAEALSERARAGVEVQVLIDWAGSQKMEQAMLDRMVEAGVHVEIYHPLRWYHLARMNNRTHRKLLIVDGEVGFTGGVGIADNWDGDATAPDYWRDSHQQLDQDDRHGAARRGVFPTAGIRGERAGTGVHQLAEWRRRQHAADVPAVDHRSRAHDRPVRFLLRPRRSYPGGPACGARTRRSRADYRARREDRHGGRPQGVPRPMGGAARGRRRDLRVPAHHVPLQDADRRPAHGVGGLEEFRHGEFADHVSDLFEADLKRAHRTTFEEWKARPWQEKILKHAAALLSSQL